MTDNEIVKALECCGSPCNICVECPMPNDIKDDCKCGEHLANYALDLINRLQYENMVDEIIDLKNEIKDLQAENEELKLFTEIKKEEIAKLITKTKAEAYKECIEKVKEYIDTHEHLSCEECECVPISKDGLDNLLKELVGEDK